MTGHGGHFDGNLLTGHFVVGVYYISLGSLFCCRCILYRPRVNVLLLVYTV